MSASEERGATGEKCQTSGVYYCVRHPQNEIPLSKGETFPPCKNDGGHATIWILRRRA
jgi:phage terminase large subunit-like protein